MDMLKYLFTHDGCLSLCYRHRHKAELEKLKKKDPDFFKFLEKTDKRLLEFGADDDEEEDDEDEAEEGEGSAMIVTYLTLQA